MSDKYKRDRICDALIVWLVLVCTVFNLYSIGYHTSMFASSGYATGTASNITMTDAVRQELNDMWVENINETVRCIHGEIVNDTYFINALITPNITYATPMQIRWKRCDRNSSYLGTVHTHPSGSCIHSNQDIFQFGVNQQYRYSDSISGVVCGEDRYLFYGHDDNVIEVMG